jgi:hypothetical protein
MKAMERPPLNAAAFSGDLEQDDFSLNRHLALSFLFEHDLRANAFAFVARENRFTLFRIMLQRPRSEVRDGPKS